MICAKNRTAVKWQCSELVRSTLPTRAKSPQEVDKIQAQLLANLTAHQTIVYTIVKKNAAGEIETTKPNEFGVRDVATEADLQSNLTLHYERIYVQDMHGPRPNK